jgi:protein-disulfide isomerase
VSAVEPIRPLPGLARLTAIGVGLGLVLVASLVLIQRPGDIGGLAIPDGLAAASPSAAASTGSAPSRKPTGPQTTDGTGRIIGSLTAPVAIEVWSDYQCPACGNFANVVLPHLLTDFVDRGSVLIVYHDYAFLGAESIDAAVGARIAAADGKFEAYHRLVFANQQGENQGAFARPRLAQIAVAAGLDGPTFLRGLDNRTLIDAVKAETERGSGLGVTSTPTLVIGGEMMRGSPAYSDLAALLVSLGAPQ